MADALLHKPCQTCGATLHYEPGATTLDCPYCGSQNDIAAPQRALARFDLDPALSGARESALPPERQLSCPSCGAEAIMPPQVFARSCDFCETVLIDQDTSLRRFEPQGLLPFGVEEGQAQDRLRRWLKSLWFAPSALARSARAKQRLRGVYVPYWCFDVATETDYRGERGTTHTVTRRVQVMKDGKSQWVTRSQQVTRWRPASGRVARDFSDLLVQADGGLKELEDRRFSSWDTGALEPFVPDYLAGYEARLYGLDLPQGWQAAQRAMEGVIRSDIRDDIGGDKQRIHTLSTRTWDERFTLVLLPIWISEYRFGGKDFHVVINGRTGEVRGQRPIAWWKVVLAVLLALGLVAAALLIAAQFEGLSLMPPI